MTLTLQHPERLWIVAAIIAVAVVVLLWGYRKSPLRGLTKWAAIGSKLSALGLLVFCLTDPVWSQKQPKAGENAVVIVADNSASLKIAETVGGPSRADAMREALGKDAKSMPSWLEDLGRMFRVKTQMVDARLQSVPEFSKLDFAGGKSELERALQTLSSSGVGSRTAAVVLITDGNPTDLPSLTDSKASGVPVFPVLVGKDAPKPDLRIVEHSVTQTSFEDTPVTITASIAGTGNVDKEVTVSVLDEAGKVVTTEKLKLAKDNAAQVVRLKVPTTKPGVSFYRLTLQGSSPEITLANNERYIAVDRGAGPKRELYFYGRPNWEYKFMRRALEGDPEIQIPSLIRIAKREPKFEWRGRTGETSNPLFRGFGDQGVALPRSSVLDFQTQWKN
ncbi:MAG: VWA domain-containing protein [Verrucomicrobia bacterium]|nr:VWA domain-containing protein [Verrucomicrobiota bacterium]